MKMFGLLAEHSGGGFPAALLTLALFAATMGAAPCPAADPATLLAARTLLLDAQVFGQTVVAVGAGGHILRSTDSGHTWQLAQTPTLATLTGVHSPDGQHGWAVGHDAIILHSEDGGLTWTTQYQGPDLQVSFLDVCFLDVQTGFVAGAYGQFLATTDGGRTWTPRRVIEEDYFLNRITAGPTGTLYLAGEHGTLLRSTDRGVSWAPIRTPYDGSFYGILPLGPKTLLAHGLRGRIYRSEDDGDTWQLAPNEQRGLLATAVHLKSGVIIMAGQSRLFAVSRDEGRNFTPWAPGLTTGVAELVEAPDGTLLAVGEEGVTPLPAP
jgi:photosystem II stability/assembly factor-like uncharacterized protein